MTGDPFENGKIKFFLFIQLKNECLFSGFMGNES